MLSLSVCINQVRDEMKMLSLEIMVGFQKAFKKQMI